MKIKNFINIIIFILKVGILKHSSPDAGPAFFHGPGAFPMRDNPQGCFSCKFRISEIF